MDGKATHRPGRWMARAIGCRCSWEGRADCLPRSAPGRSVRCKASTWLARKNEPAMCSGVWKARLAARRGWRTAVQASGRARSSPRPGDVSPVQRARLSQPMLRPAVFAVEIAITFRVCSESVVATAPREKVAPAGCGKVASPSNGRTRVPRWSHPGRPRKFHGNQESMGVGGDEGNVGQRGEYDHMPPASGRAQGRMEQRHAKPKLRVP